MNRLLELLKAEALEFESIFRKASLLGSGTPQEISDFRENFFSAFVSKYFPFPHKVTKAQIIDSYGKISDSIDCVVINPNHPHIVGPNGKFDIVLADGVDVAIELKPDISNKTELIRGLDQVRTIKQLRRRDAPLWGPHPEKLKEISRSIPGFLFSLKAKKDAKDTLEEVLEYYSKRSVPTEEQIDFIVINNTGIISNYKHPATSILKSNETGFFYEEWRELTLVAFVMKLHSVFHATPTFSHPILRHYLSAVKPYVMLHANPSL